MPVMRVTILEKMGKYLTPLFSLAHIEKMGKYVRSLFSLAHAKLSDLKILIKTTVIPITKILVIKSRMCTPKTKLCML